MPLGWGVAKACAPGAVTTDISRAVKLVERIRDHYLTQGQQKAAKQREQWLNDLLAKGMGGAHKYANEPNAQVVSAKQSGKPWWTILIR